MNTLIAAGKKACGNAEVHPCLQQIEKNNVHVFDVMGTANLSEIFLARPLQELIKKEVE